MGIYGVHLYDPLDDDALFREWCDGPGKAYPTEVKMMREIEGAPVRPVNVWVSGWDRAFYEWAAKKGKVRSLC